MSEETVDEADLLFYPQKKCSAHIPDSIVPDETYKVRIRSIYDPSKFWLVLKVEELTIFMRYLKDFYDRNENKKPIARDKLAKDLLCIVRRDNMYYRCLIQPILLPNNNKIRVFMVDFGMIINVPHEEVFYIHKKHCDVPRFAIRACLADISPLDPSKKWNQIALKAFCALIEGKQMLAKVFYIDIRRCILFVDIRTICGQMCKSVSDCLVTMSIATYDEPSNANETEYLTKYKPKVKYLHLIPTFEALESGIVPCSLWESDLLKDSVPLDMLYRNYYMYQDTSAYVNGV